MAVKINYLSNKELLLEIHKSKNSYSSFTNPEYEFQDIIIRDLNAVNSQLIKDMQFKKTKDILEKIKAENKEKGKKNAVLPILDPNDIAVESIVFRLMTFDHIPLDPTRKVKPKNEAEAHSKCNFPPYKHFVIESFDLDSEGNYSNIQFKEVGRSHWVGSFSNGYFDTEHGKITNRLAMMLMKLVDKYGQRSNWRGYTYLDEMKGQALLQLATMGLQFDESRSDNPFAYYTAAITNSFTRIFNLEKKNQNIRDDLFIMAGQSPSFTRQLDDSLAQQKDNDAAAAANASSV